MGPAERALLGAQHNVYNRIFIKIYCCRALAAPEETSVVVNADAKPSRAPGLIWNIHRELDNHKSIKLPNAARTYSLENLFPVITTLLGNLLTLPSNGSAHADYNVTNCFTMWSVNEREYRKRMWHCLHTFRTRARSLAASESELRALRVMNLLCALVSRRVRNTHVPVCATCK